MSKKDWQQRIDGLNMFSENGWKKVRENKDIKKCNKWSCPITLSDGFIEFINIFAEDNEFEDWEMMENDLHSLLIDRWSDYLLGD